MCRDGVDRQRLTHVGVWTLRRRETFKEDIENQKANCWFIVYEEK